MAIAVDSRSAGSLPQLLLLLEELRGEGVIIRSVFLDSSTDALVRRFSETRRSHPLTQQVPDAQPSRRKDDRGPYAHRALIDAIELERELLSELREVSTVVDTSQLRPAQLRAWMRALVQATGSRLTLALLILAALVVSAAIALDRLPELTSDLIAWASGDAPTSDHAAHGRKGM